MPRHVENVAKAGDFCHETPVSALAHCESLPHVTSVIRLGSVTFVTKRAVPMVLPLRHSLLRREIRHPRTGAEPPPTRDAVMP